MKSIKYLIFTVIALVLSSCHHTSEPLYINRQFIQLNTVIAPWDKNNDLLPWKGQNHMEIINSVDDIYATQTARFIEENPNWLRVDFSTKSIITVRTILFAFDYWQYNEVQSFSQYVGEDEFSIKTGDYMLNYQEHYVRYDEKADEDESQYRISQIAIVTDKIPSDASLLLRASTDWKSEDIWD